MSAPKITVIGTGYLGATHAICMAVLGFDVLGVDVAQDKVDRLNAGEVPFFEPGLPELLVKALESGKLRFTTDYAEAGEFGDVHFVCVGTPQLAGSNAADLRYVESAVTSLAPHLKRRALVVGKSTVPVGTAARLTGLLHALAPAGGRSSWPGTRSSCARATPSRTRCGRTGWSSASSRNGRRSG